MWHSSRLIPSGPMDNLLGADRRKPTIFENNQVNFLHSVVKPSILKLINSRAVLNLQSAIHNPQNFDFINAEDFHQDKPLKYITDIDTKQSETNMFSYMFTQRRIPFQVPGNFYPEMKIIDFGAATDPIEVTEPRFSLVDFVWQIGSAILNMLVQKEPSTNSEADSDSISDCGDSQIEEIQLVLQHEDMSYKQQIPVSAGPPPVAKCVPSTTKQSTNHQSRKKKRSRKSKKGAAASTNNHKEKSNCLIMDLFETLKVGGARRVTKRRKNRKPQLEPQQITPNLPRPSKSGCQRFYMMTETIWDDTDSNSSSCDNFEIMFNFSTEFDETDLDQSSKNHQVNCNNGIAFIINGNDDLLDEGSDSECSAIEEDDDWAMFKDSFQQFRDQLSNSEPNNRDALDCDLDIHITTVIETPAALFTVNRAWNEAMRDVREDCPKYPKVIFAPDESLVEIKLFEKSDEEQEFESDWFLYKLMRCRFKKRVQEMEDILGPCMDNNHRQKVLKRNENKKKCCWTSKCFA